MASRTVAQIFFTIKVYTAARRLTAGTAWFDKLTMSAHPEPFDLPLILSLSKDEHLAQDERVEGCVAGKPAGSL